MIYIDHVLFFFQTKKLTLTQLSEKDQVKSQPW